MRNDSRVSSGRCIFEKAFLQAVQGAIIIFYIQCCPHRANTKICLLLKTSTKSQVTNKKKVKKNCDNKNDFASFYLYSSVFSRCECHLETPANKNSVNIIHKLLLKCSSRFFIHQYFSLTSF